eukprot:c1241_g1_i1.p1 GENE.c1241_g1_i1~~c1241_g1_i1.p1  ORF type:complete len:153 (+),score=32.52 c1241_g1_i1:32-460(+)
MAEPAQVRPRKEPASDPKNWCVLYPAYIDVGKTVAEGRKLPKEACAEQVTPQKIAAALKELKLPCMVEAKAYSRCFHAHERARFRFQLRKDDGSLYNPDLPDRRAVFAKIAALVAKMPVQNKKGEEEGAGGASKKSSKKKRK